MIEGYQQEISQLLASPEVSLRLRTHVEILGESLDSKSNQDLQEQVRHSKRVESLLSERQGNGKLPFHPYAKWYGAHWVLSILADLWYPPGDRSLIPLREQVYDWLFSQEHLQYSKKHEVYAGPVMNIHGLMRAHASLEGNAIYYLEKLGLQDERTNELVDRLLDWQWPDGGWNCDKAPSAHTSSFTESLLPLRGLSTDLSVSKNKSSSLRKAVGKAAELFLERKLFRRKTNRQVISSKFAKLHYPCYWHYDFLFGLKVMREADYIRDERCADAIALLRSKHLPEGGFPAEEAYYRKTNSLKAVSGRSLVGWGGVRKNEKNEFVTCDSLGVLAAV